ncbi:MAG: proteasome accessory factor PafA2 family protein, partial [candidate division NC10 bacterium]|nr:proteasome accessory factor PafA2 family protein [candidate division NC10 bacterium]
MAAMQRRIFGLENEYGLISSSAGGRVNLSVESALGYLFEKVVSRQRGTNDFLRNGARLYQDTGCHPEYATPECDNALDLTIHDKAGERIIEEFPLLHLEGYRGSRPVRVGNAAAQHRQHDIFGEMVLALSPLFLDQRFQKEQSASTLQLLERLARKAIAVVGTPDAGIWEYRREWTPQTFSTLMCWAAADRMSRVAARHHPDTVQAL